MLSDSAANIMLLNQAERVRQGGYIQLVPAQQALSAPLTVLLKARCWIALGSARHGEQILGADQDKEALHQACRLQAHLALDIALSAASQYGIMGGPCTSCRRSPTGCRTSSAIQMVGKGGSIGPRGCAMALRSQCRALRPLGGIFTQNVPRFR